MGRISRSLRLLVAVSLAAALAIAAVAPAAATTSWTDHLHAGDRAVFDLGPTGCTPGFFIVTVPNAVQHDMVNNAGDEWFTATVNGTFVTSDASGYVGHNTARFGFGANAQNGVNHGTLDAVGTLADGTILRVHQEGQFTVKAQGVPVVTRSILTCG